MDDVVALTQETGLGIVVEDSAKQLLGQGADIKDQGQATINGRS